jgi:hypothetical protein
MYDINLSDLDLKNVYEKNVYIIYSNYDYLNYFRNYLYQLIINKYCIPFEIYSLFEIFMLIFVLELMFTLEDYCDYM